MNFVIQNSKVTVQAYEDLELFEKQLLTQAVAIRDKAYAPYSKFKVGAALLCERGCVHPGCNVERCSYTQGSHAEQVAVDNVVVSHGAAKIRQIAIVGALADQDVEIPHAGNHDRLATPVDYNQVVLPCGHCRQIIWEFCCNDPEVEILSLTQNGLVVVTTIGSLLPAPFGPEQIGIDIRAQVQTS